jgi:hypothetical protein
MKRQADGTTDRPDRLKTSLIAGHWPENVGHELARLAAEKRTTRTALLSEGLALVFERNGWPVPQELDRVNFGRNGRRRSL